METVWPYTINFLWPILATSLYWLIYWRVNHKFSKRLCPGDLPYSNPAWIFPSLLAWGLLRNSIIEKAVILVQVPKICLFFFFFWKIEKRELKQRHKAQDEGPDCSVCLATKKPPLEAFSSSPQNKKTLPRSGPGHQSSTYRNKSAADHWPREADENGSTAREEKWVPFCSLLSFRALQRIQKIPLIFLFKKLPLQFMRQ